MVGNAGGGKPGSHGSKVILLTERGKSTITKISFKIDGEVKSFTDKQKLREFSTIKLALQQMLKGLIESRNTREEKRSTKSTPNN